MTNTTRDNPRGDVIKLTPSTVGTLLFNIYNKFIFEKISNYGYIEMSGIYRHGKGTEYGKGIYYDQLEDEDDKGKKLTLIVGEELRSRLQTGKLYNLRGILEAKKNKQSLGMEVLYRISEIVEEQSRMVSPEEIAEVENKRKLLEERNYRGTRNLRSVIQNAIFEKGTIKGFFIYGTTAIVDQDVENAMRGIEALCDSQFEKCRIPMSSEERLVQALNTVDKTFDFIAIVRGGGTGIEIFVCLVM